MENLEATIASYAVTVLLYSCIILFILAVLSLKIKPLTENLKKIFFTGILLSIVIPTLFLITSTIYLNVVSVSKGPVHWHADIEIYSCGKELDLKDPIGWSNKIGTSTLHEHNDKRIHMEGVVVETRDASLGKFFEVIGGVITSRNVIVPINDKMVSLQTGDQCPSGEAAELQVFVYKINKDNELFYTQQKLPNPAEYIISPFSAVPSGDCIIIDFDTPKSRTEHLCRSYKVAKEIDKLEGEIIYGN